MYPVMSKWCQNKSRCRREDEALFRVMTIHYEAEEFIVHNDTQWVVYNDTINEIIQGISQSDS